MGKLRQQQVEWENNKAGFKIAIQERQKAHLLKRFIRDIKKIKDQLFMINYHEAFFISTDSNKYSTVLTQKLKESDSWT